LSTGFDKKIETFHILFMDIFLFAGRAKVFNCKDIFCAYIVRMMSDCQDGVCF